MVISPHYSLGDFGQPPCRGMAAVRYPLRYLDRLRKLAEVLELLTKRLDTRVRVLSGFRSVAANLRANGDSGSTHLTGLAADVYAPGVAPEDIFTELYRMHGDGIRIGGLGLWPSYVHVDVREGEGEELVMVSPERGLVPAFPTRETICLVCERPVRLCREMKGPCSR